MIWNPDGSRIMYRLQQNVEMESRYSCVAEEVVDINSGIVTNTFTHLRMPTSRTVWTPNDDLYFVRPIESDSLSSSQAVWKRNFGETPSETPIAFGHTEDAVGIVGLGVDSLVAVEVASGLDTRVDIIGSEGKAFTIFETDEDAITYMTWDIKRVGEGRYVFAALRSSGVRGEPENVWSGTANGAGKGAFKTKLSSHHAWFEGRKAPISKSFHWESSDGEAIYGIISFPPDRQVKYLPTIVIPHVGPYW